MMGQVFTLNVASDDSSAMMHTLCLARTGICSLEFGVAYRTGKADECDFLELAWHEQEGFTKLPFKLDTEEKLFCFVRDWLSTAEYGEYPDTDGSAERGWSIRKGWDGQAWVGHHLMCRVQAEWIIYGK